MLHKGAPAYTKPEMVGKYIEQCKSLDVKYKKALAKAEDDATKKGINKAIAENDKTIKMLEDKKKEFTKK